MDHFINGVMFTMSAYVAFMNYYLGQTGWATIFALMSLFWLVLILYEVANEVENWLDKRREPRQ